MNRIVPAMLAGILIAANTVAYAENGKDPLQQMIYNTENQSQVIFQDLEEEESRLMALHPELIRSVQVEGISVKTTEVHLGLKESAVVTAEISPANASVQTVKWTSADPEVATVIGNGCMPTVMATGWGRTVITGRTDDGNYTCSFPVSVGNYSDALKINYIELGADGESIRISVTNQSDMQIKSFSYKISAIGFDGKPEWRISDNGKGTFQGVYTERLLPGGKTRHGIWSFYHYHHGFNSKLRRLTIWLLGYTTQDGTVYTYKNATRPRAVWNRR